MKSRKGFSLLELLAATVILGILITIVLSPISQLFRNTSRSGQTLRVTTEAQEMVEYIRGQWRSYPVNTDPTTNLDQNVDERIVSRNRYDRTCFTLPTVSNMTFTVTVRALDRNASTTSTLNYANCPSPLTALVTPPNIPIKRITVTLTSNDGRGSSTLTTDIPRP